MGRVVDGIEIPDDLDGINDDIALGLMKDHGLISDPQEKVEATTVVEPTNEQTTENQPVEVAKVETEITEPVGGTAPVKQQETGGVTTDDTTDDANGKTVPYQAMIAERNKRKKEQSKNEALEAEIAQLRAQYKNPTQVQPPSIQQPVIEQKPEETIEQQQALDDYIEKSAVELFVDKYKREPDELSRTDNIILGRYAAKVEDGIEKLRKEQEKIADEAQKNNLSYRQFVTEQQGRDEYEEIITAFVDEVKALEDDEREIFKQAFQKCETGKGTPQEILLVKKFWNDVAKKTVQSLVPENKETKEIKETPAVVIPPKPAKTAEEKLEQIEKHPKTNLVTGSNASNTTSVDEIARLMRELPWPEFEKKYPEYAKLVLEG